MLPFGGVPPFLQARPAYGGCVWPVPLPLLPTRGLRVLLGLGGGGIFVLGPVVRGIPALLCLGVPPVPLLHDVGARCWVGGPPPPLPTSAATCVKRGQPFGGSPRLGLSSVGFLSGERALWVFVPLLLRLRSLPVRQVPMAVLAAACLRRCLPVHHGLVACAPPPPSSSPSRSTSTPSLPLCVAVPKRPNFVLPFLIFSPLPPAGPCGRSTRSSRSFPRPRPPISPVGTKISEIGRAGLLCLGW